jgi:hypothetical protein
MRRKLAACAFAVFLTSSPPLEAQYTSDLTINGYTSLEFEEQLDEEGGGDPNGSFDADLFDLVLNFQVNDAIRVATDLTWEHGAATEEGFGNVAVEYAFIEYAFSDLVKVRAGKMFTPFGIYNEIHTAKPAFLTVKEPASTNKTERIVANGFRFFPRWGAGISVHGDGLIGERSFSYDVLVANGAHEEGNPFEEDNNAAKSVTGRFRFEPSDALEVGSSFYYDLIESGGVDRLTSLGLELRFQTRAWRVLAETAYGWLDPDEGDSILQIGWYVQPSYEFDNGMTPYARVERINPDTSSADEQGYDFIVGLNYEIAAGFMIKVENNWFKGAEASTLAQYPGAGYSEIKAAVVLGF